ncbi:unnamed protein product [Zymoseptoria tritici ST99CH_3D1]|nr:unnamed protein product [Zymoseptoria tritici ST99CH_3D1]
MNHEDHFDVDSQLHLCFAVALPDNKVMSLTSSASRTSFSRLLSLPPAIRRNLYSTASASTTTPEIYDVVCIGGGPAGLSLISALRSSPSTKHIRIALIDGQDLTANTSNDPEVFSNRCSSLTPSSVRFLRNNGAWDHVNTSRVQPYHSMDVWDGVSGSKIKFDPSDGSSVMGSIAQLLPGSQLAQSWRSQPEMQEVATMCENSNLTSALLNRLKGESSQSLTTLPKTRVQDISFGAEPSEDADTPDLSQWPIITLPDNSTIAARLLVGADGANSPVRAFANIPAPGWDYPQHGLVATLSLDTTYPADVLRTAYQRFLPTGPIALLPLPGNKASLVWSITAKHAAYIKTLPPASLLPLLNAAFRVDPIDLDYHLTNPSTSSEDLASDLAWRESVTSPSATGLPSSIPRITAVQPNTLASFPLRLRHADTYTSHRIALIGDAAHTLHPLAGQGLNLGLADAECLARCIARGADTGMDIGTAWCLDQYNSERWAANNAVMGTVDKLSKLFSVQSGPVVWARSFGLGVFDRLGVVKGAVMMAAAGR